MKPLADNTSPGSGAASPVRLAIDDGIAILTLDDPMSRNAIDASSGAALIDAIDRVVADARLRVLLLRAEGPMFCPGASMAFLAPDRPGMDARIDALLGRLNRALVRLAGSPVVVVAAVHGAVAGGGLGLMNLADLVLAADDTRFNLAYAGIGATPDLGATWHLPRLIGERRALELLLLSAPFDAHRALEIGLVNAIHPRAGLDEAAIGLARRLRAGPAGAQAAMKRLVQAARSTALADQLEAERETIVAAARGPEFAEGVRAFLDRRPPRFPDDHRSGASAAR